jgi:diguanylate cyclase (GGDEF)-like protein
MDQSRPLTFVLRVLLAAVNVALLVLIAILDRLTGAEVNLSIFYLIPIALTTWYLGGRVGMLFAFTAAAMWALAALEAASYSRAWIPVWNLCVRLGMFVIVAVLVDRVRTRLDEASYLADTDPLTELPNRRHFKQVVEQMLAEGPQPVTLALVDVYDIRWINDRLGMAQGDVVVRVVARAIERYRGPADVAGRLTGSVFGLLMAGADEERAASTLPVLLEDLTGEMTRSGRPLVFGIGAVTGRVRRDQYETLMSEASDLVRAIRDDNRNEFRHRRFGREPVPAGSD